LNDQALAAHAGAISMSANGHYDVIIIGAGIVGLSTAVELLRRFPRLRVLVLEKEMGLARHQTGNNSGVIHSGIYYKPGSLKARTCVQGAAEMLRFCKEQGIAHQVCGKVIVATNDAESLRLEELFRRGQANGVPGVRMLGREELREIEPYCFGIRALHVPGAAITDYSAVSARFAALMEEKGGAIRFRSRVSSLSRRPDECILQTDDSEFKARYLVNCAGLHSDSIARLAGDDLNLRIVPFRGEYYDLKPERQKLVNSLIYPVPDPRFPFLGVHFTRRINGSVDAGPNAVLALKREGYRKTDISLSDMGGELSFPGFWRMAAKHWRSGLAEMYRSLSKTAFVRALQRLVPDVTDSDLAPGKAGVRAQAVSQDGSLIDDFKFVASDNVLHVCNVPSPAATASIPIGRAIVEMASTTFHLNG